MTEVSGSKITVLDDARRPGQIKLITISIPVYNEEGNIARLLERLRKLADAHASRYTFEFLFTDNASEDRTYDLLREAAEDG